MELIIFIIVGAIGGYLANLVISRGADRGLDVFDFVFGILGAIVGGYLMDSFFGYGDGGLLWSIVVAFIGALLLAALYRLVTRRSI